MKLRTTRYFITLIALLVAGIATTNAQTTYNYNVQGWTPYGSLTLQNLTIKNGTTTNIVLSGNKIEVRQSEGQINVDKVCDSKGSNCRTVSQITTGTMPTIPAPTSSYWKLNPAGNRLLTSGDNYGLEISGSSIMTNNNRSGTTLQLKGKSNYDSHDIEVKLNARGFYVNDTWQYIQTGKLVLNNSEMEINGQGNGISVSDGNVDIQQGSLNTWYINDNQNHNLTIESTTNITSGLTVDGETTFNGKVTFDSWVEGLKLFTESTTAQTTINIPGNGLMGGTHTILTSACNGSNEGKIVYTRVSLTSSPAPFIGAFLGCFCDDLRGVTYSIVLMV